MSWAEKVAEVVKRLVIVLLETASLLTETNKLVAQAYSLFADHADAVFDDLKEKLTAKPPANPNP